MKFSHIADCHIGGWREPRLRDHPLNAFMSAVDRSIAEKVDFVLICGDLFNTSMPAMDQLRGVVVALKRLTDASIPAYVISGSHDYSPSGRSILEVLESAGLVVNVARGEEIDGKLRLSPTVDPKTRVSLVGMVGRKGGLDAEYYPLLDYEHLARIPSPKIFLFHSAITEMKPEGMESMDGLAASFLPPGFDYYAGGHVHVVDIKEVAGRKQIAFPGPTFPNSFSELEELGSGGFFIVEGFVQRHVPMMANPVVCISIDCHNKSAADIAASLVEKEDVNDKIALLRLSGTLSSGRISDVPIKEMAQKLLDKGAYCVLRNTNALKSKEFEKVNVKTGNIEEIENNVIKEHISKGGVLASEDSIRDLIRILSSEKMEGETKDTFERRIVIESARIV